MAQPLALKYRPRVLSDVVGQPGTVKVLDGMLRSRKVPSAIILHGIRGTGKTTLARIMAAALNCQYTDRELPCGKCNACLSEDWDNVVEIDAASNRGIQQMLELLRDVGYQSSHRYTTYIIDEVHMLTPEAMGAFLKTLEEPPKGVLFVLATTDYLKVLPTIRSRCLDFQMRPFTVPRIAQRLGYICRQEGIKHTRKALERLAMRSESSMRDAIMHLESAVVFASGSPLTIAVVRDLFGDLPDATLLKLAKLLLTPGGPATSEFYAARSKVLESGGILDDTLVPQLCNFLHAAYMSQYDAEIAADRPAVRSKALAKLLIPKGGFVPALLSSLWNQYKPRPEIDRDVMFLHFREYVENPDRYTQKVLVTREIVETVKRKQSKSPEEKPGALLPQFINAMGLVIEQGDGRTTLRSRGGKLLDIVVEPSQAKNQYYILLSDIRKLKPQQFKGPYLERNGLIKQKEEPREVST